MKVHVIAAVLLVAVLATCFNPRPLEGIACATDDTCPPGSCVAPTTGATTGARRAQASTPRRMSWRSAARATWIA
jgi:hypothetical protein